MLKQVNLIVAHSFPTLMHQLHEDVKRAEAADSAKGVLRSGQHLHRVQELTLNLVREYLETFAKDLTELLQQFEHLDEETGSWLKSRLREGHDGLLKSQTEAMRSRANRMGLPPASVDASLVQFTRKMGSMASKIDTSVDISVNKAVLESSRQRAADGSMRMSPPPDSDSARADGSVELEQKFRILYSPNQLQRDLANEKLTDGPVSLLFLDIDGFKTLNSRFTETTVDVGLLPDFQKMIVRLARSRGRAYRQGGEEFCILLPNHSLAEAQEFAERVRREIEAAEFQVNDQTVRLTVSVGVGTHVDGQSDLKAIVQRANTEERHAKTSGGNCVRPIKDKGLVGREASPDRTSPPPPTALGEELRLKHFRDGLVRCPRDQALLKVWETTGFGYHSPGLRMQCPVCIFEIDIDGIAIRPS